jgi:hypothetical protein
MKFYTFNGVQDNIVDEKCCFDLSFEKMVEFFDGHDTPESKDTFLFSAVSYNTKPSTIESMLGLDEEKELPNVQVRRYKHFITHVNAIVLDYDSGCDLVDTVEFCSDFNHIGYTSYSHLKDGKTHKFRIIIPFKTPCPVKEWECRKHDILKIFPNVDQSTITTGRVFYFPSCPPDKLEYAMCWNISDKIFFDWNNLEYIVKVVPEISEQVIENIKNAKKDGKGKIIFESFDAVQFMKDNSLYIKCSGFDKHDVICPQYYLHTNNAQSGTVLFQDNKSYPTFYCSHSHCQQFNFYEHFKNLLGKGWMNPYCNREV